MLWLTSPWFKPTKILLKNTYKFSTVFLSTPKPVFIDWSQPSAIRDPKVLSRKKNKQRKSTKKPFRMASKRLWPNMTQKTTISLTCKSEMWLPTKLWRLRLFTFKNFLLAPTYSMSCIWQALFILAIWPTFLTKFYLGGSEIERFRQRENSIGTLLSSLEPAKR